eukprot:GHVU01110272.1.p1 GENE.GHVU01110272.1~~GHVU01110272.1.p1  ORF type:complete len:108 (+),score=29.47 GHVU01110272.1:166-489(+)
MSPVFGGVAATGGGRGGGGGGGGSTVSELVGGHSNAAAAAAAGEGLLLPTIGISAAQSDPGHVGTPDRYGGGGGEGVGVNGAAGAGRRQDAPLATLERILEKYRVSE